MLVEPSIEKIKKQANCPFEAAILVSQRARQLTEGAQPMVADKAANNVSLACCEVASGTVVAVPGQKDPVIPITREERIRREEERRKREQQLEEEKASRIGSGLDSLLSAMAGDDQSDDVSADDEDAETETEE
ncbi:MAG: DNA-directed RNA polymerase subunit omega [Clostridiales bacterium]|nr:DNA-directed RNA polymerase subunit omega [Clostridiales bacterium]